jgi:hypothetical protein
MNAIWKKGGEDEKILPKIFGAKEEMCYLCSPFLSNVL